MKRFALLGFPIECNRFAPIATEADFPGLTSPVLSRFAWTNLPRPVLPLDTEVTWP